MDWNSAQELGSWLYGQFSGEASGPLKSLGLFGVTFASAVLAQLLFWDIHPDEILKQLLQIYPRLKEMKSGLALIALFVVVLGAFIGYSLFDPRDMRQATFAGVGWYAAFRALRTKLDAQAAADPQKLASLATAPGEKT